MENPWRGGGGRRMLITTKIQSGTLEGDLSMGNCVSNTVPPDTGAGRGPSDVPSEKVPRENGPLGLQETEGDELAPVQISLVGLEQQGDEEMED